MISSMRTRSNLGTSWHGHGTSHEQPAWSIRSALRKASAKNAERPHRAVRKAVAFKRVRASTLGAREPIGVASSPYSALSRPMGRVMASQSLAKPLVHLGNCKQSSWLTRGQRRCYCPLKWVGQRVPMLGSCGIKGADSIEQITCSHEDWYFRFLLEFFRHDPPF